MAPKILALAQNIGAKNISDYGSGKCNSQRIIKDLGRFKFRYSPYDPAFPEYGKSRAADLVCCLDVLEYVELEYLNNLISGLGKITCKIVLYIIHTGPAIKFLPDGRNAHLIQEPSSWRLLRLCSYLMSKSL